MTAERLNELKRNGGEAIRDRSRASTRAGPRQRALGDREISCADNRSATLRFAVGAAKAEGEGEIAADGRSPQQPVDAARGRPLSKNSGYEYSPRSNRGKTELSIGLQI
jgi:hypothetical protein